MVWADKYPSQRLSAYDDAWPAMFTAYREVLSARLGAAWRIEHVGSTSVPGLVAKPVIDVALGMPAGWRVEDTREPLRSAGWSTPVPVGDHWTTVYPTEGVRAAIGHVFTAEQWPQAHVRLFAAWLRAHSADRGRYAALKLDLVEHGIWDSRYTEAKAQFVLEIVNKARASHGLAPVAGPL